MANGHVIVARHPTWLVEPMTLTAPGEEGGGKLEPAGEIQRDGTVHGHEDEVHLECSCGATFGTDYAEAQSHLSDIANADNGEAVASMADLQHDQAVDLLVETLVTQIVDEDWTEDDLRHTLSLIRSEVKAKLNG